MKSTCSIESLTPIARHSSRVFSSKPLIVSAKPAPSARWQTAFSSKNGLFHIAFSFFSYKMFIFQNQGGNLVPCPWAALILPQHKLCSDSLPCRISDNICPQLTAKGGSRNVILLCCNNWTAIPSTRTTRVFLRAASSWR